MANIKRNQLIKQIKNLLVSNPMLLVAHSANLTVFNFNTLKKQLKANNFKLKVVQNSLVKQALQDTIFKNLNPLFFGPTVLIYSSTKIEDVNFNKIIEILNQEQNLILLGAKIENQLLTISDLRVLLSLTAVKSYHFNIVNQLHRPGLNLYNLFLTIPTLLSYTLNSIKNEKIKN